MKIAAAQIDCQVGEIQKNLNSHFELIELAIENGVDLITFPEMSITGYCREEGDEYSFSRNDTRLQNLQELSSKGNIVIVAGAPIRLGSDLYIGSFIMNPDGAVDMYTKQYLHDGEQLFYSSSKAYNPIVKIGNEIIALAICADVSNSKHPKCAKENGATLYAPSIFYSIEGMRKGNQTLEQYSKEHQLSILMSNYSGNHWSIDAGGKSGFWNSMGIKLGELDERNIGLVLAEKMDGEWTVTTIEAGKNRLQHAV